MEQGIIYRSSGSLFNYIGWPTVAKDENGVYTFTMPAGIVTVTAVFREITRYSITVNGK